MLGNVAKILIFCALSINFSLAQNQNNCVKPKNVRPTKLSEIQGIWYLMQTDDQDIIYKDLKCVRGQIDDLEDHFKSEISTRVCKKNPAVTTIGVASNLYLNSSTSKYENALYAIVPEGQPGVFKLYSKNNMELTIYILLIVPNEKMIFSCCFEYQGQFMTQINKYYVAPQPRLNEQEIADDYEELGISITHNKYISQFDSDCINETYYGA